MFDTDPTIGHRLDRSHEQMKDELFLAVMNGDETRIMTLQQEMRMRFGDLF